MKEYREKLILDYLQGKDSVVVTASDLAAIKNELANLKAQDDAELKRAVAIAEATVKRHYEGEIKIAEANYKAKEAENIAMISSLNMQLAESRKQTEMWKTSLDSERQASVERSKNSAIGNINVGQGGK